VKNFLVILAFFSLIWTGCPTDNETNSDKNNDTDSAPQKTVPKTVLKIKNESSKIINDVLWNNVSFKKDESGENADLIGTWIGRYDAAGEHSAGEIEFELADGTWSLLYKDSDGVSGFASGNYNRSGNNFTLRNGSTWADGTASLSGNKLIIRISNDPYATDLGGRKGEVYELIKTIPLKPGTNFTKDVEDGNGYIFFKVGLTAYRTRDLVIVEKDKEAEFIFTDYTLVVDVINDNSTVTLGGL